MVQYDFAESPGGGIVLARDLSQHDRQEYQELTCPGCGYPMIPVVGTKIRSHFRHKVGERCDEYFAMLIEKVIVQSFQRHQESGQAYPLLVSKKRPVDLAKVDAKLHINTVNCGKRVDLRFRTDHGQIDVIIARRHSDLEAAKTMEGFRLVISAPEVERLDATALVQTFRSKIDTDLKFIYFFTPRQTKPNDELKPHESELFIECSTANLVERAKKPQQSRKTQSSEMPIERQPNESERAYRIRILGHDGTKRGQR